MGAAVHGHGPRLGGEIHVQSSEFTPEEMLIKGIDDVEDDFGSLDDAERSDAGVESI